MAFGPRSGLRRPANARLRGSGGALAALSALTASLLIAPKAEARRATAAAKADADADAPRAGGAEAPDPAQLRAILAAAPGKRRRYFATVVDLDSGAVVVDIHGDEPAYPASVAKLFTTAASVLTFKGDERLETSVRVGGRKGARADVVAIVGGGDPALTTAQLAALADKVVAAGIREVGTLVVDHTLFDDALPRGYAEKSTDASYRAPIDALEVNGSTVAIAVRPGGKAGDAVSVELSPPSDAVLVIDEARTGAGKKSTLAVSTRAAGKVTEVRVQGVIGVNRRVIGAGRRRVADAGTFAGEVFRAMLVARGVHIAAKTAYRAADSGLDTLASHRSEPIDALLAFCTKWSNNLYAETFFKLVGARGGQRGVSAEIAEQAMRARLAEVGVDGDGLVLGNGSGLYHANRVTTNKVVALLAGMARSPHFERYRDTLAIAGVDGTLRGRLRGAATKGKVFAKTGTLDDVTALAGYALGNQRRYAFALLFNDVAGSAAPWRRIHDRFVTALLDPSAKAPATAQAKRRRPPKRNKRRGGKRRKR